VAEEAVKQINYLPQIQELDRQMAKIESQLLDREKEAK
jgi:hypothetical protein